ncbi:hypothetical protein AZE42_07467 [Rhizopogon vesiculosus]|uniref:Reverse transcriptase domain-containing protein n=1 Tax=Rhizopogon vesiculosus TaxID=180088 RepID=A0A1J8Q2X3_9AGAM|nr:hypothetical protein AZE42_07467 [Rhizopogon vesiculosus]
MPSLFPQFTLRKSLQGPWAGFLTIDDPLMRGDDSNICTLTHRCLFTTTSSASYTFSDERTITIAPTKSDLRPRAEFRLERRRKRDPPRSNATNGSSKNPLSISMSTTLGSFPVTSCQPSRGIYIAQALPLSILPSNPSPAYSFLISSQTCFNPALIVAFQLTYCFDSASRALIYKPVTRKVHTVPESITEDYHITRRLPDDPIVGMAYLPTKPPNFIPGIRFTQEHANKLDLDSMNWLWPEELKLIRWLVLIHEAAFIWEPGERGQFKEEYFPPIKIAMVPHTLWVQRNIPIPPAIFNDVINIIKGKIEGGVYEPLNAAYHSRWFCIVKKDGKLLRLVHDLQPLNAVTVKDAALPPFTDHLTEAFAGYPVYGMMDLYGGYDH